MFEVNPDGAGSTTPSGSASYPVGSSTRTGTPRTTKGLVSSVGFARELATGWLWNSFLEQYAPISIQAHGKRYILSKPI